ncbi:MAG: hypothetical protein WKG00_28585 [Polyangiaceae bacterium]
MRLLVVVMFSAVLCSGCVEPPPAHLSAPAFPIKSACTALSQPAASVGLDIRAGRRHSQSQTIFVTNVGDRSRSVRVAQVSRVEGPCSGDWARQTPLSYVDAATTAAPAAVELAPGQALQLEVGAQRVHASWACTKLGLAVWASADGATVCADAGAWIAERDDGYEEPDAG